MRASRCACWHQRGSAHSWLAEPSHSVTRPSRLGAAARGAAWSMFGGRPATAPLASIAARTLQVAWQTCATTKTADPEPATLTASSSAWRARVASAVGMLLRGRTCDMWWTGRRRQLALAKTEAYDGLGSQNSQRRGRTGGGSAQGWSVPRNRVAAQRVLAPNRPSRTCKNLLKVARSGGKAARHRRSSGRWRGQRWGTSALSV